MTWTINEARSADLDKIKSLCDSHRPELGFVMRPSLALAIDRREIFIACDNTQRLVGFVHFRHRRDQQTTLYHIAVDPNYRLHGIGTRLIEGLEKSSLDAGKTFILLKCPVTLSSNKFYERVGFRLVETLVGKARPLNLWRLDLKNR
jgi:N-acetylglutamate synthase-like GNAT family acetyltransferase